MKLRHLYLLACIPGALWPLACLVRFIQAHGLSIAEFIAELHAGPAAHMFAADVLVSALVLVLFVRSEARHPGMARLRLSLLGLLLGVSLALPLFLYLRQSQLDARAQGAPA